jgi:hypothetical protein
VCLILVVVVIVLALILSRCDRAACSAQHTYSSSSARSSTTLLTSYTALLQHTSDTCHHMLKSDTPIYKSALPYQQMMLLCCCCCRALYEKSVQLDSSLSRGWDAWGRMELQCGDIHRARGLFMQGLQGTHSIITAYIHMIVVTQSFNRATA